MQQPIPWEKVSRTEPLHVLITGAAGQIGYNLCFLIGRGFLFDCDVILHLYDLNDMALKGLSMELTDCCLPKLKGIISTTEVALAFSNVDVAIIVAGVPRKPGMQRSDLINVNKKVMEMNGKALGTYSNKDVRVVVVANPANTNAYVICKASGIPPEHITALTRLDQNRATAFVANEVGCQPEFVHNIIVWGNHSNTMQPDLSYSYLADQNGIKPLANCIEDFDAFTEKVRCRGEEVINTRKASSAGSAAHAICQHIKDWIYGTKPGIMVSMGVSSNGEYGIDTGLFYSMPVTCSEGEYHIVDSLIIEPRIKDSLILSELELIDERNIVN
ncbi:hypothetical protein ENUP19_0080G0108 [Entamoeba nuttalli]|uniref:Malate dehydrogenase n=2 Tax=Entamoeba nuttalli TaxID=412467 RepID=K2GDT2_ENTNP|nr:malate dehydrogenase, putative [Entamoeba nuttalli P19]EKE40701.1 malate dehydrogenase, putative [Entamoeba nuttalli P19]|eukprot:XP_008856965.1 malate dehydrogenase, putative [Entamoeba nuttalli P19]